MKLPKITACPGVYEPAEDSWLLQQAVARFSKGDFLDLGCGTGMQGVTAALSPRVPTVVFGDISPRALECARVNAAANGVASKCEFVATDLFSNLAWRKFDCIAFNPPYLPTAKGEKIIGAINRAYDGGRDGRKVTDRFIKNAALRLNKGGTVLVVSSSLASTKLDGRGNEETRRKLEAHGFAVSETASDSFFFERLAVFKAVL